MSNLTEIKDGKVVVSSKAVADHFNKSHKNVMRDIKAISKKEEEFGRINFEPSSYTSIQNKTFESYDLTRDGFTILAMGFTGEEALKWKIKYMEAFNKMEAALSSGKSLMTSLDEIVARAESDKNIASQCASQLSRYREIKQKNEEDLSEAYSSIQLALGFSS